MAAAFPIIPADVIRARVALGDLLEPVARAFEEYSQGKANVAPVGLLYLPAPGDVHIKSAYIDGHDHYAVKIVSGFPGNPARGLPVADGMIVLFAAETGVPAAILHDEGYLTDLRTAAAGAVAARALAPEAVESAGVIGTGVQARLQALALHAVRPFSRLAVWGRNPDRAARLADELQGELPGVRAAAVADRRELVAASDVVITTTPSHEPLVEGAWLRPGQHVTAVGADDPQKCELDGECLRRADRVIVDSVAQNLQFGDVHRALRRGEIDESHVHGEIGQVLSGAVEGRRSAADVTIAKLTGIGIQDLVAAEAALAAAGA
jgi:ornithine cyclodeaminase